MADDDGKPAKTTDPQPPPLAQVKPVAPAPRINPPNVNAAKESPPAGSPPGFGDFLEWMRVQMGGAEAPTESQSQRTLIPKEKKKFQRRDAEPKSDKTVAPAEESEDPGKPSFPVAEKPAAGSGAAERELPALDPDLSRAPKTAIADADDALAPRVRRGQQAVVKRNPWVGLAIQIGVLSLLGGSFLLGRASVSRTAPPPAAAPAAPEVINPEGKVTTKLLSDANASLIDQAMTAEQSYDFKKARELLEKVKASGEHVHGITFQLAQLASFSGEYLRAVPLLNEALNEGDELASTYNLRATLSAQANVFRGNGMNDFETASKIDPFDARTFFFWGGALRLAGKSQAALVRLGEALDRLREPTAEGLYRLTIRLTQLEIGREKEFADEFNKQMALPNPGIDWLFTAAALKVRDNKLAEAAAFLTRAEQLGDPDAFSLRLRDYFFHEHRFSKELKPFFDRLKPLGPSSAPAHPVPADSPSPSPTESALPAVGLDVQALPPPASPNATIVR